MSQALPRREDDTFGHAADPGARIAEAVARARRAMDEFYPSDQARVDEAVTRASATPPTR